MVQLLQNIKSIKILDAAIFKFYNLISGKGLRLNYKRLFSDLPLCDLAKCEVLSSIEDNTRIYKTTITARLHTNFDFGSKNYVFLLTCVNGDRFILGTDEIPHPLISFVDEFPDKPSGQSGRVITVECTDTLGLIPVLDEF